jgi:hypothetical protein
MISALKIMPHIRQRRKRTDAREFAWDLTALWARDTSLGVLWDFVLRHLVEEGGIAANVSVILLLVDHLYDLMNSNMPGPELSISHGVSYGDELARAKVHDRHQCEALGQFNRSGCGVCQTRPYPI